MLRAGFETAAFRSRIGQMPAVAAALAAEEMAPGHKEGASPMICEPGGHGLLLPLFEAENHLHYGPRAAFYGVFLIWLFAGVAIIADVFMNAIERITSQEKKVMVEVKGERKPCYVRVWNPTVANLTLMALGSSAPEILLSVIELLGSRMFSGDLGPSTIVGSASFNLLVIIGICVVAIPDGQFRAIREMGVYLCTAVASVLVYVWLVIMLQVISPELVEPWEGILTFIGFPVLVWVAYLLDIGYFSKATAKAKAAESMTASRVLGYREENEDGVPPSVVATFLKEIKEEYGLGLPPQLLAQMVNAKIRATQEKAKSRAYYRVQATRTMTAGRKVGETAPPSFQFSRRYTRLDDDEEQPAPFRQRADEPSRAPPPQEAVLQFSSSTYRVLENVGTAVFKVVRQGNSRCACVVKYLTVDGEAKAGQDYQAAAGELTFEPGQTEAFVSVRILDDNVYEPDESFDILLSDPTTDQKQQQAILGERSMCRVTIIDDDFPGVINFKQTAVKVIESCGRAVLQVERTGGARGRVGCSYTTVDGTAIAGADYKPVSGELVFEEGEALQEISIEIIDDINFEKDETFRVVLTDATGGAQFGFGWQTTPMQSATCEVTIISDDETASSVEIIAKMCHIPPLNRDAFEVAASSWCESFRVALQVNGGDEAHPPPTATDWAVHFITLPFKLAFTLVPPVRIWDGKLSFAVSLLFIGFVTAIIGDVASIFGCCLGLPDSITAITLVAMGTSLPDTFASKSAAVMDDSADASIVNVTGSNAVNVLLGLGLPWMLGALYWARKGATEEWIAAYPDMHALYPNGGFVVRSGNLVFSVSVFTGCALICISALAFRRYTEGYELGGALYPKWLYGSFFILLWLIYLALSCWHTLSAQ